MLRLVIDCVVVRRAVLSAGTGASFIMLVTLAWLASMAVLASMATFNLCGSRVTVVRVRDRLIVCLLMTFQFYFIDIDKNMHL